MAAILCVQHRLSPLFIEVDVKLLQFLFFYRQSVNDSLLTEIASDLSPTISVKAVYVMTPCNYARG